MARDIDRVSTLASALFPGAVVEEATPLGPDPGAGGEAEKAAGYGQPLRVRVRLADGAARTFVFRTEAPNEFGHDRRADRFEEAILSYDLFAKVPDHVRPLDVGALGADGRPISLRGAGEPYLVTEWAEGTLYAEDLRRIARDGAGPLDLARCEALARWLVALHRQKLDDPPAWRRAVRDLLGHGEGIFGMVDGYPDGVPGAPAARLRALEEACLAARWSLRGRADRLARTHGDFHPFNVVFRPPGPGEDGTRFTLLDASRGGRGDPADDVVALSVNYVLFALDRPLAWGRGLGALWRRFWEVYRAGARDPGLLEAAPAYLAWRALVLASPRFYPRLSPASRDLLLGLAERALAAGALDLAAPGAALGAPP